MTKRVQIIGHPYELAVAFVGLDREVTADEDNRELRLHDGVTPGGRRFLDRDANDERYQARSVELDGLLGWEPSERGILVRLGPSDYRLRKLVVDPDNITLTNDNGYSGNPTFSLADTVASSHLWSGVNTYSQGIVANGGVAGNLTGNVVGNVVGDVVGNLTGNVVGNLTGNTTGTHTGSVDVSGGSMTMADEQILLQWLSPAIIDYIIKAGLPVGSVVAYAGEIADIPTNWYICDGTNGTPDLRDRFIYGASATYIPDTTGGAATHSHAITVDNGGSHNHTGTVGGTALTTAQLPTHFHYNGVTDQDTNKIFPYGYGPSPTTLQHVENSGSDGAFVGKTSDVGSGDTHNHSLTIDNGGSHNHTASSAAGSSLPPFYAMIFIMKGA